MEETKQGHRVLSKFKENITKQRIAQIKQMIKKSREDTRQDLVELKKDAKYKYQS